MKNKMNPIYASTVGTIKNAKAVHQAVRKVRAFEAVQEELSTLNTMRGGSKGFKGFVGESMEAAESSARGRATIVLNDNGIADLKHIKADGTASFKQVKIGYKPGQIDFARYKGQTIVMDKGNPHFHALKAEAAKSGVKVVEGHVTEQETKLLADAMQLETKVTGKTNATLVPKVYQSAKTAAAAHHAGVSAAKSGAAAGAGFSLGKNIVQVAKGNKTVAEAAGDVIVDTAEAGAISYGAGAAGSLLASTEIGAAALETAGAVGATISSAPVISSAVGAGTAITGAIGGAGASAAAVATGAVTSAVASAATAASSVAAGTAAAGAVGAIGSGAVAATAAIGAATVAAAPVLVVGGIIGGLISLFDD